MSEDQEKTVCTEGSAPAAVVNRLSLYLRELQRLDRAGAGRTNSSELGACLGLSDAQVRKDLAHFGQFGHPGVGYRCKELIDAIRAILGTNQTWRVALVGAGNLGRALAGYQGFGEGGFDIVAAFDCDPTKIGQMIEGLPIEPLENLPHAVKSKKIRLAIVAVPASQAQAVANQLAAAGVEGVLNFAPVMLPSSSSMSVVGVDLTMELEKLAFQVTGRNC